MSDELRDFSPAEKAAFRAGHRLIWELERDMGAVDASKCVLIAAVACLGKSVTSKKIAQLLYALADDYAVQDQTPSLVPRGNCG